uniref:Uncharacterized protein n=1 Tax=Oryza glumipatula TaxID=40148 RepID=A0A0E0A1L9_9ORYZ
MYYVVRRPQPHHQLQFRLIAACADLTTLLAAPDMCKEQSGCVFEQFGRMEFFCCCIKNAREMRLELQVSIRQGNIRISDPHPLGGCLKIERNSWGLNLARQFTY